MKDNILHISHTNISFDSRILKEIKSLSGISKYNVIGFGIRDAEPNISDDSKDMKVKAFQIFMRRLKFLPRPLRLLIMLPIWMYFEILVKIIFSAIPLRPRVIHCHDTLVLPIGVLLKIFTGAKLIYDAHELESRKNLQSRIISRITLGIERVSWGFVDVFISVSPSIIEWYERELGPKENALILNSPVFDSDVFQGNSNNYLRERFNIPANEKVFIYIGIIGRGRGINLYLEIFKLAEITSHVVFLGFGELVSKVKEYSESFGNIHYLPPVAHHEVVKIAKSADIGLAMIEEVSLSDYYCLPNKLFEYAFSGLFVITSDFPDMKRVVQEYDLGVTCAVDIDALRDLIKKLSNLECTETKKDLYKLSWQYQEEVLLQSYHRVLTL
jgi:glycosyltransferase involved in cell wall biosynthesis